MAGDERKRVPFGDTETQPGYTRPEAAPMPFRPSATPGPAPRPASDADLDHLMGGTLYDTGAGDVAPALPFAEREAARTAPAPVVAPAPVAPSTMYVATPPPAYVPQPTGYVHGAAVAPPPIVSPIAHDAEAARGGVAAASHAAADAQPVWAGPRAAPEPTRGAPPAEIVELLWVDEAARARVMKRFRAVLEDLDPEATPEAVERPDDVVEILVGAAPTERVGEAVDRQLALTGARFVPPVEVLRGTLRLEVDTIEVLKVVHEALSGIAAAPRPLSEALEAAGRALRTPSVLGEDAAERHLDALHAATANPAARATGPSLRASVTRALACRRQCPTLLVFGADHARLTLHTDAEHLPLYVPVAALAYLPAQPECRAVVIAEVRGRAQDGDPRYVLRALAIARVDASTG
jgi:hypothetical protein